MTGASARPRLTSHFLQHKDLTTAYYDEGSGPVLLLLHGFTGGKLDFHDQLGWFTDRYRVLVPDQRGHGESTNSGVAEVYRLTELADDLHSFIETLHASRGGLQSLHLLGHSMGGMVAMRYALDHPARLLSLLLMDTASAPLDLPGSGAGATTNPLLQLGAKGLVDMMKAMPVSPEVQHGIDFLGEAEHWARIQEKLEQMDPAAFMALRRELGQAAAVTQRLAAITCPTTVLVGAADKVFIQPSKAMAAVIPGASLAVIAAAAHCPQYENASAWRASIDAHLNARLNAHLAPL